MANQWFHTKAVLFTILSFLSLHSLSHAASSGQNETRLTWHGHAAFEIVTPQGKVLWIDPWLKNPSNPAAQSGKNPLSSIQKADYILVTHGHSDHVGDSLALAKKTGAKLVTNFDLARNMVSVLGFPKDQAGMETTGNIGGELVLEGGQLKIAFTPAIHSSGLDSGDEKKPLIYGGNPAGFIVQIQNGPTFYHSGDTAYFKDMEEVGIRYSPDVALVNIGGHFGMSPEMAAKAVSAVKAKIAVPHHYKTFPILTPNAESFVKALSGAQPQVMEVGSTLTFHGKALKTEKK